MSYNPIEYRPVVATVTTKTVTEEDVQIAAEIEAFIASIFGRP